ncbi:hypothetical protein EON63_07605 [archaeon]|nr:MAG: hypothetical protein EON63_07605 [archaeon]
MHNSTHLAQQLVGTPYLDQAFSYSVVGALSRLTSPFTTPDALSPGARGVGDFFVHILSQIYYPPLVVLQDLLQTSVYWVCIVWFLLCAMFMVRWLVDMEGMKKAASYVL